MFTLQGHHVTKNEILEIDFKDFKERDYLMHPMGLLNVPTKILY